MKRIFILFAFLMFLVSYLFPQPTDEQIYQYAKELEIPYDALKQLVDLYRINPTPSEVLTIDENELHEAYVNNNIRANTTYRGKQFRVTGRIIFIGTVCSVIVGNTLYEVRFRQTEMIKLGNLTKDQTISFIGTFSSYAAYDRRVVLNDAILVQ